MVFHSKRDKPTTIVYFVVLILSFFLLLYSILMIVDKKGEIYLAIFNAAVGLIVAILILIIYLNTFYELRKNTLVVRSGPFIDDINYKKIESMEHVKTMAVGAALAKNRLKLECGKRKNGKPYIVYISPEKESEFIKEILKKAPKIRYIRKEDNN